ncbi:M-phase phosphoprotein 9-like [Megalops cyprinoides]|uniref:M-phase phosphoprotein 9-like n=1 Tax=Megalops cyprinoides TaxID=118141 RepID=UPI0018645B90|nr:M-phase phosphoprotein 9-like [Megalops cyprinoides]
MSTDDSISEDVSTSAALSHNNADASGGKESEASIISSEGTPSGPTGLQERSPVRSVRTLQGFLQAAAGAVRSETPPTPASRNLCLSPEEFSSGRSLPSINPSPLETLTALVQEIHNSGETDPELWKDSEGRWLHLFKLVEKQYQEQILAQQEQYQCQIQLIQDEIKALVQLQNRPSAAQLTEGSPAHTPGEPSLSDPEPLLPPPSRAHAASPQGPCKEGAAALLLSSGYGTQSASEHSLCRGEDPRSTNAHRGEEDEKLQLSSSPLACSVPPSPPAYSVSPSLTEVKRPEPELSTLSETPPGSLLSIPGLPADQPQTNSQSLTTWAQRQKHRQQRNRLAQGSELEAQQELQREQSSGDSPPARADSPDNNPPDKARLSVSLRDIYQSKQREETRHHDRDNPFSSATSVPQVSTLHVTPLTRTTSFTSPFRCSSPSFPAQLQTSPAVGAPIASDSTSEGPSGQYHADNPKGSSLNVPVKRTPRQHLNRMATAPCCTSPVLSKSVQGASCRPCSKDEASRSHLTAPSRMDPWPPAQAMGSLEKTSSLGDPVMLSLARQSMKEKTSRHIADLRAYYESEISMLKEKLGLVTQPPSCAMKETNQLLQDRCENLEKGLTEARAHIQELEDQNLLLERQLAEWQERYDTASATVQVLQERLEETKQSGQEKDATADRLQARLRQLEEAYHKAYRVSDDKDAQRKKEHKMLQDLIAEYEALGKDHTRVKEKLASTENRLFDANAQISELKRIVSKLESQIKQLEHENLKTRHLSRRHSQPVGAGMYHYPDLLLSPGKNLVELEASCQKWPDPCQPPDQTVTDTTRRYSPPEKEETEGRATSSEPAKRDSLMIPLMKSLIQMEEIRATDGQALHRPNVHSPSKRDALIAPLSAKSSPKRCPSENFSTAFGPSSTWQPNYQPGNSGGGSIGGTELMEQAAGPAWEEQWTEGSEAEPPPPSEAPLSYEARLHSLADMERLFDELTHEKQQIEAALSRIPGAGGRVTLQAKLDEEALEDRLEKINRELGSIRMTLKKFHVLRSSANI